MHKNFHKQCAKRRFIMMKLNCATGSELANARRFFCTRWLHSLPRAPMKNITLLGSLFDRVLDPYGVYLDPDLTIEKKKDPDPIFKKKYRSGSDVISKTGCGSDQNTRIRILHPAFRTGVCPIVGLFEFREAAKK